MGPVKGVLSTRGVPEVYDVLEESLLLSIYILTIVSLLPCEY
jgi:hypothetical protein